MQSRNTSGENFRLRWSSRIHIVEPVNFHFTHDQDILTGPGGDLYYSCHDTKHEFCCRFVVGRRLIHLVPSSTPVSERLATIRLKAKFFKISLICVHVTTQDKEKQTRDIVYERLEEPYDHCPWHYNFLGDFNAKIDPTVGKDSIMKQLTMEWG